MDVLKQVGTLFYMVNPYELMYEKISDIPKPDLTAQAMPYFIFMIFLEHVILKLKGEKGIRLNDGLMSVSNGVLMFVETLIINGGTFTFYFALYENYRLFDLPWDNLGTWILAMLLYDLGYYWVHRAAHELNILWAAHQVHHSSEDYNLAAALRQSMMQKLGTWPFYLPMALLGVPPTQLMVHAQLNLIYQYWIHTEVVGNLGPLEWVLNTARHHRVHHGSNRYCLDKNYAGVLIIWDRLFGTFEEFRPEEEIVYGLVDQPQFFNPLRHQFHYYGKVFEKAASMDSWKHKILAFIYGPGWFPGTERLGDITQVPEIPKRAKYDPKLPGWVNVYVVLQFILVFLAFNDLVRYKMVLSQMNVIAIAVFVFWTLTSIGMIFDKSPVAWPNELVRASTFYILYMKFGVWSEFLIPAQIMYSTFLASITIASIVTTTQLWSQRNSKKIQ